MTLILQIAAAIILAYLVIELLELAASRIGRMYVQHVQRKATEIVQASRAGEGK